MKLRPLYCDVCRPLLRSLPRGAIRLLTWMGGGRQDAKGWENVPNRIRIFRDPLLDCYIIADLSDWGGRWYYYAGRYYDRTNQVLIQTLLTRGDSYIDIGANLGIHTLLASRTVGSTGHVHAFEPDPRAFAILNAHLTMNRLANCDATRVALGDVPGSQVLHLSPDHTGTSSLRPGLSRTNTTSVSVCTADDLFQDLQLSGNVLVKIDVEGYEFNVLKGMRAFLREYEPAVVAEMTPEWIIRVGGSASELLGYMDGLGFQGFHLKLHWAFGIRPRLALIPLEPRSSAVVDQQDILFISGTHSERWLSRLAI